MSARPTALLGVAGLFALLVLPRVAPATVAEQRARLPPPKACDDPVAGVWMSHQYAPRRGTWDQFTLTIRRDAPGSARLVGTIHNHVWGGGPNDEQPPPCDRQLDVVVRMSAEGEAEGQKLRFDALDWTVETVICRTSGGYDLDHFSGTIDPALQEFQSINTYAEGTLTEATVFRRIRCLDEAEPSSSPPPPSLAPPPPFQPPSSGCEGWA